METLFEIILLAAAAYGVKHYFFTAEAVKNREVFSSRGSTLVKRRISQQTIEDRPETIIPPAASSPLPTADNAPPATTAAPEASTVESIDLKSVSRAQPTPDQPRLIPEDSVLNRHYWAQRQAEQAAIQNPYPTDSVLRRHYQQQQTASLPLSRANATLELDESLQPQPLVETTAAKPADSFALPEDSVLKRHALSQVRQEFESQYPAPSDSLLKRHHHQWLETEWTRYLASLA